MTAKEMKKAGYRSDEINAVVKAKWEQARLVASEAWAKAVAGTPPRYVYRAPKKSVMERW